MRNNNEGFLKKLFGGSSIIMTIISGFIVGMLAQWMARRNSEPSGPARTTKV